MKLNRKGYMLVEIILASVLAMSIAYYLLNLTYRFKDKNQDIYQSIEYNNVKNLITKNIMNDLSDGYIALVDYGQDASTGDDYVSFFNNCIYTRLTVQKESDGTKKIIYGEYTSDGYNTDSLSYYEKEIPDSLMVGNMIVDDGEESLTVRIPISSIYSEEKYDINILVSKADAYMRGVNFQIDGKMYYYGYPENSKENSQIQFALKINGLEQGYVGNICTQSREIETWEIYGLKVNGEDQVISPIHVSFGSCNQIITLKFISDGGVYRYQGYEQQEDATRCIRFA